jgi:predicted dehydrogenase
MAAQEPLRIGIVGCGQQGRSLAAAVTRLGGLRLAACADPSRRAVGRVAALAPDATTHPSAQALLGETEVDAVIVATPPHSLAQATLAALQAGKHVLVEKPLALNEAEAAEVEAAARCAGVCCMVGYALRYYLSQHLHDLLRMGAAGEIVALSGAIGLPPLDHGWSAYRESGGGPLLQLGSQLVDFMLWCLADEPAEVLGHVRRRSDTEADDTTNFQVRFSGGAVAQGLVTQSAMQPFCTFEAHGRAGRVSVRAWNCHQFELEVCSRVIAAYAAPATIRPLIGPDMVGTMLVPELEAFARAIREGTTTHSTASDGRRVLRVLDAIVRSSDVGRPVALDGGSMGPKEIGA